MSPPAISVESAHDQALNRNGGRGIYSECRGLQAAVEAACPFVRVSVQSGAPSDRTFRGLYLTSGMSLVSPDKPSKHAGGRRSLAKTAKQAAGRIYWARSAYCTTQRPNGSVRCWVQLIFAQITTPCMLFVCKVS